MLRWTTTFMHLHPKAAHNQNIQTPLLLLMSRGQKSPIKYGQKWQKKQGSELSNLSKWKKIAQLLLTMSGVVRTESAHTFVLLFCPATAVWHLAKNLTGKTGKVYRWCLMHVTWQQDGIYPKPLFSNIKYSDLNFKITPRDPLYNPEESGWF